MSLVFPDPEKTDDEGLLCYGGNLESVTLLKAYSMGIFPWYDKFSPILWWSPPVRMILKPEMFKPSKSLSSLIKKNVFDIKFDNDFETVISLCASTKRKGQKDTWITTEMQEAYIKLHKLGYAHSVETYEEGKLAGGAVRCFSWQGFFWRIHVSYQKQCFKSSLLLSSAAPDFMAVPLYRRTAEYQSSQKPRCCFHSKKRILKFAAKRIKIRNHKR